MIERGSLKTARNFLPAPVLYLPLLGALFLPACSHFVTCEDGVVKPGPAALGVAGGAVGGAAIGAAVSANVANTTLIGGLVGGVMGVSIKEAWGARDQLRRAGVGVIEEGAQVTLYIPVDLCFDPATDILMESCYPVLDQVAVLLKTYRPNVPMAVIGHTDNVGSPKRKQTLTDNQARAIAAYLWAHGVPYQQLKIIAAGSCDPVASNLNARGSAENRRVQINIRPNQL